MYAKLFLNTEPRQDENFISCSIFKTLDSVCVCVCVCVMWRWDQRTLTIVFSQCFLHKPQPENSTVWRERLSREAEVQLANTVISIWILGPHSPWRPWGAGGDLMFSEGSVTAGYGWCCRPITLYLFYLDFSNWKKIRCQDFAFC
jgi:hypothetical protein